MGEALRNSILGASGFAVGVLLFLAFRSIRGGIYDAAARSGHFALATARLSTAVAILLIAEVVYRSLEIPPTWRAFVYTACLVGIAGGYAWALHKHVAPE